MPGEISRSYEGPGGPARYVPTQLEELYCNDVIVRNALAAYVNGLATLQDALIACVLSMAQRSAAMQKRLTETLERLPRPFITDNVIDEINQPGFDVPDENGDY